MKFRRPQRKDVRHQPDRAIQQVLKDPDSTLPQDLSNQFSNMNLLKEATSKVDSLRTTNHTHNGSPSLALAPINQLPPEILLCVLQLSICLCPRWQYHPSIPILGQHHSPRALIALTHVCTRWRAILINTALLWSHLPIDVMRDTSREKSREKMKTYFARAQDQGVCVQFDSRSGMDLTHQFRVLANNLHPYLGQVGHLHFVDVTDHNALLEFLTYWLANGSAGSVLSFVFWLNSTSRHSRKLHSTTASTQHRESSFLLPIRVLRLNGGYFDWASPAYHNLLILEVGGLESDAAPTLKELLDVLSASPQLQCLRLANMPIRPCRLSTVKPVVLSYLKDLTLLLDNLKSLCMLLPMIILPSRTLRVKLRLVPSSGTSAAGVLIQSFLSGIHVTRLDIGCGTFDDIAAYLAAVPHIHTLLVDLLGESGDNLFRQMTRTRDSSATRTPLCPNLNTLYVANGQIQKETLQQVVEAYPLIKQLILVDCFQQPFDTEQLLLLKTLVKDVRSVHVQEYWLHYTVEAGQRVLDSGVARYVCKHPLQPAPKRLKFLKLRKSLPKVITLSLQEAVEEAIKAGLDLDFHGGFAHEATTNPAPNPGLEVQGCGPIGLPLSAAAARTLIAACEQAPFGKGGVRFTNPAWEEFVQKSVEGVCDTLGVQADWIGLKCELHKILVHEQGSHFLPHVDTEKQNGMFATMVIVLPSLFEGGAVHLTHGNQTKILDVSGCLSAFQTSVLEWPTNVMCEVKPITSGYRLALAYNPICSDSSQTLVAPSQDPAAAALGESLPAWLKAAREGKDVPTKLARHLEHKYSRANMRLSALIGKDTHLAKRLLPITSER